MDDLLNEFLTETSENLSVLDVEIVQLERNPNDPDLLGNIFRLVHTIKGTCGFLGLPRLEAVAHAGENVLGKFRDGELEVTPAAVTLILEAIDRIKLILEGLEENEEEPEGDDSALKDALERMAAGDEHAKIEEISENPESDATAKSKEESEIDVDALMAGGNQYASEEELQALFDAIPYEGPGAESQATTENTESKAVEEVKEEKPKKKTKAKTKAKSKTKAKAKPKKAAKPKKPTKAKKTKKAKTHKTSVANQTIRINVDVIEDLMNMASELVLTRNQLLQILRNNQESEFSTPLHRLNQVVSELQDGVVKTRMQPVSNAWTKLPRIIRDLSMELGKKIDLDMKGAETELDRQVLELIKDPLTHMVRNSADHGLEGPEERLEAGKPETGTVELKAYHEGGHIIIEINDDGRGINIEKVTEKAIENGVATAAELEEMSDSQIYQLIFQAGFSTAEKVTSVSGRGVGMDVVRTNIEKIGGTVELQSTPGKGSSFLIKIPLTLAIVSALIVSSAKQKFAIPQLNVLELVRTSKTSEHRIESVKDTPVLRLRNRLLPLLNLDKLLKLDRPEIEAKLEKTEEISKIDVQNIDNENIDNTESQAVTAAAEPEAKKEESYIVIVQIGTYNFGIVVDEVFDTEEIVVKPKSPILKHIDMFSGNTILGDGSVVMILDPNGIAAATGEISIGDTITEDDLDANKGNLSDYTSLMVFRAGNDTPKAVPLSLVARLEEIDVSKIEISENSKVIQYRGQLMPLIPFDENVTMVEEGVQPMIVFSEKGRSMGLIVDEIIDIVEENLDVQLSSSTDKLMGSAVLEGKTTEIVNVAHFLSLSHDDWFETGGTDEFGIETGKHVLIVDDSAFFRNMLGPLLKVEGYTVSIAEDGQEALDMCQNGGNFDIIVSDIDMPRMNGFELAENLREDEKWQETPLIALTSFASNKDRQKGISAGFNEYIAKMDRGGLLRAIENSSLELRGAA